MVDKEFESFTNAIEWAWWANYDFEVEEFLFRKPKPRWVLDPDYVGWGVKLICVG